MHRYLGMAVHTQDIFVNIVGGMKVVETSSDLAVIAALISSERGRSIPHNVVIFGELGLGGEVRPVQNGQARIMEAAKHGFVKAIVPRANMPKKAPQDMTVVGISQLPELIDYI